MLVYPSDNRGTMIHYVIDYRKPTAASPIAIKCFRLLYARWGWLEPACMQVHGWNRQPWASSYQMHHLDPLWRGR